MKKGLTEVVFILDRSGSMQGLEADTIGGFNSLLEKQKKEEGEAVLTTVLFDDKVETLYDRVDLREAKNMTEKEYFVRGCTALLDAIGSTVHAVGKKQKELPEEERPEKTLFIITTDGMENASREYNHAKVKKMIEKKKSKHGWEFLFLGANIDAVKVAGNFGIAANRAVNYKCDKAGTAHNFATLAKTVGAFRNAKSREDEELCMVECCASISADYEARK
ncbi:MAG: hypothetical protein MJ105_01645 [Lachnospiraceae bacterium]|nr:hypothetical protein [Lachnospiraceae bacterium]